MEALVRVGPLSTSIDSSLMEHYKHGVLSSANCSGDFSKLDHAVLLVGYGVQPATDKTPKLAYWSAHLCLSALASSIKLILRV